MRKVSSRGIALELLNRVFEEGAYANLFFPALLNKSKLSERDSAFSQELAFSTIRWKLTYDAIINKASSRPTSELDPTLLNCLRLGVHQLLQMRVPPHAAISETVDLVRLNCGEKVVGFANAVLRKIAVHSFESWLDLTTDSTDPIARLSLRYSHPEWIVRALKQALEVDGLGDQLELLLKRNNEPAAVNLVALPGLTNRDQYLDIATPNSLSPWGFSIKSGNPAALEGFDEGRIRVQDEGSQIAVLALLYAREIRPLENWLDMCAGPGGKASLLAALAVENKTTLLANEPQHHRAKLVRSALEPFQINTKVSELDGRDFGTLQPKHFDRILVDAPCTGLGALRRRPEARWRKSNQDLKELTALQFELLRSAGESVKPGGLILYVTCSPHLSETTALVSKTSRDLGLEVMDLSEILNQRVFAGRLPSTRKTVQLHTQRDNTDSMFMALLTKPS